MKKFVVSTADVYGYSDAGVLLFVGKTLLDASIETTLANTDVRAGRGNALQYIYYHTAEMKITVSDAQWNLDFLAKNVGADVQTNTNVFTEESVTLDASKGGSVTGTPLTQFGGVYGWVTLPSGTVEKVTFSTKAFTTVGGAENDVVCVRYYAANAAARYLQIRADMIPSIVYLVMEAQLCSSDVSTNKIGTVQITVPKAQMTGAFSISLKPDGVASTPLNVRALKSETSGQGCGNLPIYATITEILDSANWYDTVEALAIVGGDFTLANGDTQTLSVRAIPTSGAAFIPPYADLNFSSSDTGKATVDAAGLVTGVAAGTSTISVNIKSKTAVDVKAVVTVPA